MRKHLRLTKSGNEIHTAAVAAEAKRRDDDARQQAEHEARLAEVNADRVADCEQRARERQKELEAEEVRRLEEGLRMVRDLMEGGARLASPRQIFTLIDAFRASKADAEEALATMTDEGRHLLLIPNQNFLKRDGGTFKLPRDEFFRGHKLIRLVSAGPFWILGGEVAAAAKAEHATRLLGERARLAHSGDGMYGRANRTTSHTGKTERNRISGALAKAAKNRSDRATNNRARATATGSGSSKKKEK